MQTLRHRTPGASQSSIDARRAAEPMQWVVSLLVRANGGLYTTASFPKSSGRAAVLGASLEKHSLNPAPLTSHQSGAGSMPHAFNQHANKMSPR